MKINHLNFHRNKIINGESIYTSLIAILFAVLYILEEVEIDLTKIGILQVHQISSHISCAKLASNSLW